MTTEAEICMGLSGQFVAVNHDGSHRFLTVTADFVPDYMGKMPTVKEVAKRKTILAHGPWAGDDIVKLIEMGQAKHSWKHIGDVFGRSAASCYKKYHDEISRIDWRNIHAKQGPWAVIEPVGHDVSLKSLIAACAASYGLQVADLKTGSRARAISSARQIYYFLARAITPFSLNEIARPVSVDHSTVQHGCKKVVGCRALYEPHLSRAYQKVREANRALAA